MQIDADWKAIIDRYEKAEAKHLAFLLRAAQDRKTTWWVRRQYFMHLGVTHSTILEFLDDGVPIEGRARIGWHRHRRSFELAIAQLRDETDRRLLEDRNQHIFDAPAVPSINWLMDRAKQDGLDENGQYERVLYWVLRPDLYSYRLREFGGAELKRLKSVPKPDPRLLKTKTAFSRGDNSEYPLCSDVDGKEWKIRVNDFPDMPLYTLMVDGIEAMDFDNWPKDWRRAQIPD